MTIDKSSGSVNKKEIQEIQRPHALFTDGPEPRFKILHRLGHGAFGEVFKGMDLLSGEIVALKRMYLKQPARGISRSASNEVAVLQAMRHDNVVRLIDIHRQAQDDAFENQISSLLKLNGKRPFTHEEATGLMKQILTGLKACHAQGIMHRDLKPSNLLMTSSGLVKLADFGQSRFFEKVRETRQQFTPTVTSRWYRAPELLFASRTYDASVDIWAAAMIYIELLSGHPFLAGESDLDQISRTIQTFGSIDEAEWPEVTSLPDYGKVLFDKCDRIPLHDLLPDVHPQAIDLLTKILQYNPSKRPSAAECLQHAVFCGVPDRCDLIPSSSRS